MATLIAKTLFFSVIDMPCETCIIHTAPMKHKCARAVSYRFHAASMIYVDQDHITQEIYHPRQVYSRKHIRGYDLFEVWNTRGRMFCR